MFGPNVEKMESKRDIQGLVGLLDHAKPAIRMEATQSLCVLGDVHGLKVALTNEVPTVRTLAAYSLGKLPCPDAVGILLGALQKEEEPTPWKEILGSLSTKGLPAIQWIEAGRKQLELGRPSQAASCFGQALSNDPSPDHVGMAAGALLEAGSPREALPFFEELVELAGDQEGGWTGRAWCLAQMGREEEAMQSIRRALSIDPGSSWARQLESMLALQDGDCSGAREAAEENIRRNPGYIRAYVTLSEALARSGELNAALETLGEASRRLQEKEWAEPEDLQAIHLQSGLVFAMKGDGPQALSEFRRAREIRDDQGTRATHEAYQILTITGLALKGKPLERQARVNALAAMRCRNGYENIADKIVAEGTVEECLGYDWLSKPDFPQLPVALLRWWSPQEMELLLDSLSGAGRGMLVERLEGAIVHSA